MVGHLPFLRPPPKIPPKLGSCPKANGWPPPRFHGAFRAPRGVKASLVATPSQGDPSEVSAAPRTLGGASLISKVWVPGIRFPESGIRYRCPESSQQVLDALYAPVPGLTTHGNISPGGSGGFPSCGWARSNFEPGSW